MDFLKFIAALMNTNSHFEPLYEDVSPSLAIIGVYGNALLFFLAVCLDVYILSLYENLKNKGIVRL